LESEEDGRWLARAFHRAPGAARLTCSKDDITELPHGPFAEVRIVRFTPTGQVHDYNPVEANSSDNLWIFGNGLVRDLGFDPKEWEWRKIGALKACNFFSYETKKGYQLIIQSQYRQLNFNLWMERSGYSIQQRRTFFRKL
jgi:hypothetical protein